MLVFVWLYFLVTFMFCLDLVVGLFGCYWWVWFAFVCYFNDYALFGIGWLMLLCLSFVFGCLFVVLMVLPIYFGFCLYLLGFGGLLLLFRLVVCFWCCWFAWVLLRWFTFVLFWVVWFAFVWFDGFVLMWLISLLWVGFSFDYFNLLI